MDIIYLTDELIIKDNKMYKNDKLIKNHNWHFFLDEIGWCKLNRQLTRILNKYNDNKYKINSLFGCLECGDDGNCLFNCIAYALNSSYETIYEPQHIREIIADSITNEQYKHIISLYRIMKDSDDFHEEWNPYDIKNLESFKNQIKTMGHTYWGDFTLLELMMNTLHINIFILNQDEINNNYGKYHLPFEYNSSYKTIILLYENNSHFKLIGYFYNNNMITLFTNDTLPTEINRYCNV